MAKLKLAQRQVIQGGGRTTTMGQGATVGAEATEARALAQIQDAGNKLYQGIRQARMRAEISNRLITAQQEYSDYWTQRSTQAGGFDTLVNDSTQEMTKIRSRAFDGIGDADAKALLSERFNEFETNKRIGATSAARKQEIEFADQQTVETMRNTRSMMDQTDDPDEYNKLFDDAMAAPDFMVGNGLYTQDSADRMKADFVNGVTIDKYEKLIRVSPESALTRLSADQTIEGLSSGEQNTLRRKAMAEVNRRVSADDSILKAKVDDVEKSLTFGYIHPDFGAVYTAAQGTKYSSRLTKSKASLDAQLLFARSAPDAQANTVERMRSKPTLTGAEIDLLKRLEKIKKEQEVMLEKQPVELAIEKSIIPEQAQIDWSDPESAVAGMRAAAVNYKVSAQHFGRKKAGALLEADVISLNNFMASASVEEQVARLGVMTATMDTAMPAAMRQLSKKGGGQFAIAGQIMADGDRDAAILVLQGRKVLKDNKDILPPYIDLEGEAAFTNAKQAYATSPEHWAIIKDAILATYAAKSQNSLDTSRISSTGRMDESVKSVTNGLAYVGGGFTGTGGVYTVLPDRNVDPGDFEDFFDDFSADDVETAGGLPNMSNVSAARLIQDGWPVNVGAGRYQVWITNYLGKRAPLLREKGVPLVINWADFHK